MCEFQTHQARYGRVLVSIKLPFHLKVQLGRCCENSEIVPSCQTI